MICRIVLTATLFLGSLSDIKKHEIPLSVVGFAILFRVAWLMFEQRNFLYYIGSTVLIFFILFVTALFSGLGGGDCIIFAMCTLYLGLDILYALALAFMFTIPYTLYMEIKKSKHEYAFVPYISTAVCIIIWR